MFGRTDGNVIEMGDFFHAPKFRALREVEAYWEGLRRGSEVPRRSDIDPRGIENALEYAFILEKIAPGLARLRIAGMHLCDLMGMEVRGMPISSFLPPAGRKAFAETIETVTNRPAAARLTLEAEGGIGRPALSGQMVLLPMMSDFGDVTRILGAFETDGKIGRGPRRFEVTKTELRGLDSTTHPFPPRKEILAEDEASALTDEDPLEDGLDGIGQDRARDIEETAAALRARLRDHLGSKPGFGEADRPFAGQTTTPRKTGESAGKRPSYLRLIKSDD
ncbi:PAS domain-containing protein [Rhodalgimonas zhirmunskyi]|uniref:PAS domain-containing protein n=1 Tax=Rhodalgimonas zhirmunskyi TaxID=2964767 RepID=A0AAJ1U7K6_9RHOB|nr:PAS domain-containing protein [Rhodoalgimonas zhirmunskyi]MDQ2092778.1 PAS domain-containing protein [Rhodoalgimonas zhirmunskyi]